LFSPDIRRVRYNQKAGGPARRPAFFQGNNDRGAVVQQPIDVVALGGNAILPAGKAGTFDEQVAVTQAAMFEIAGLVRAGRRVVLTHGNGPIVGNIVIRNEAAKDLIAPMPLDVCGADSQGGIGYMIQRTLRNALLDVGVETDVVAIVTQVTVDPADPAFEEPTKPIGPFYGEEEARRLAAERGWRVARDSNRGYRRVVASPYPRGVVEQQVIARLIDLGTIVITLGGGGIPVVKTAAGYEGREAVVDKDLASSLLARQLNAQRFVILTDVDAVYRDYGTDRQSPIRRSTAGDMRALYETGQFPAGSMGSKIRAAVEFIEGGGEAVLICRPGHLDATVIGREGTTIVRNNGD